MSAVFLVDNVGWLWHHPHHSPGVCHRLVCGGSLLRQNSRMMRGRGKQCHWCIAKTPGSLCRSFQSQKVLRLRRYSSSTQNAWTGLETQRKYWVRPTCCQTYSPRTETLSLATSTVRSSSQPSAASCSCRPQSAHRSARGEQAWCRKRYFRRPILSRASRHSGTPTKWDNSG